MIQIMTGIMLGVFTSFLAGLFLIWKGESLVEKLRRLPVRLRVKLFSRAYLRALKTYPYHLFQLMVPGMFCGLSIVATSAYGFLTYTVFQLDLTLPPEEFHMAVQESFRNSTFLNHIIYNPWILLIITFFITLYTLRLIFIKLPLEIIIPYAHRELTRIRECVAKCATKNQFLQYTDAEHSAKNLKDLQDLLALAKSILESVGLDLADEVIASINEDIPKNELVRNKNKQQNVNK